MAAGTLARRPTWCPALPSALPNALIALIYALIQQDGPVTDHVRALFDAETAIQDRDRTGVRANVVASEPAPSAATSVASSISDMADSVGVITTGARPPLLPLPARRRPDAEAADDVREKRARHADALADGAIHTDALSEPEDAVDAHPQRDVKRAKDAAAAVDGGARVVPT